MAANASARRAKALQEMIKSPKYPLTDDSRQILCHEAAKLLTGHALPDSVSRLYSNGDMAEKMGASGRNIMKTARRAGMIPPEGQKNEFGTWKMSKSPYSPHECPQWYYNEIGY